MACKCGSRFRKPVSQITDRAKRYRANTPECRPAGPKVCKLCGSRRNVVPDHIDGDESNNRPSNLRWLCKACNTTEGKRMAKLGKGKRTRQFNPRFPEKIAGHEAWAKLMASKLAETYDGWRKSGLSRDESIKKTLSHTTAGPKSKALFLELAKNPGATNLAQYVQAAVDHTRGAHDAGGVVLHETPKAKRREYAREIWFRRGFRNPVEVPFQLVALAAEAIEKGLTRGQFIRDHSTKKDTKDYLQVLSNAYGQAMKALKKNPGSADTLYKMFHGRGPDRQKMLDVELLDPFAKHPALAQLGKLRSLTVGEFIEKCEGADGIIPVSKDPQAWAIQIDFDEKTAPDLAAEPDGRQLFIVGGNQDIDRFIDALRADPSKDPIDCGFVYRIEYFTRKGFDRFQPINYWHHFGEESNVQPRLIYDRTHHRLALAGGEYVVKREGIVN